MQGSIKGFNTAVIKHEGRFFALALKLKQLDNQEKIYYLQHSILFDFMQILMSRVNIITQRLTVEGETYKNEIAEGNKNLISNIPVIEISEVQQPDSANRITSLTLKPGVSHSSVIVILHNEQVEILNIDDKQVGAFMIGVQQALKNADEENLLDSYSTHLDHILLYATDMTGMPRIDYEQYEHAAWKHAIFTHYVAVLYCFDIDNGKKILAGAVLKTSIEHRSAQEEKLARLIVSQCPKLKAFSDKYPLSMVMTQIIPSTSGRPASLDDCLKPLRSFCADVQASLPL